MPRLDLGISRRKLTRGLQPEIRMPAAKLLKGDTKIKSWYDGKEEGDGQSQRLRDLILAKRYAEVVKTRHLFHLKTAAGALPSFP
jgi:hypothetical protein